jgi:endonuclease V-like protein UPF0215 family
MLGRPHLLGIDDGPFEKWRDTETPIVGVVMEASDLVEGVAITRFPIDGSGVTGFLAGWIEGLRFRPSLQGILLGGITIAGLAMVDLRGLAARLGLPVLSLTRKAPHDAKLEGAVRAAGLEERLALLKNAPAPFRVNDRLHAACAGIERSDALALLAAAQRKAELPEPLRLAHLIASAVARGQSRGAA